LPSILDLRTHLAERSSRLRTLIILLNEYDLVPKVCSSLDGGLPLTCNSFRNPRDGSWHGTPIDWQQRPPSGTYSIPGRRERASLLSAGILDGLVHSDDHHALLHRSISNYMSEHGEGLGEDPTRTFFKNKVC
jgi:hypothetical protein